MRFGTVTITKAEFDPRGKHLIVSANVRVNSTGWRVKKSLMRNSCGEIIRIDVLAGPPPRNAIVGMGFPSNGQEVELRVRGRFAKSVDVVGTLAKLTVTR